MPTGLPRNFFLPQFQRALGTVVHATPVVEALRLAVPHARIVVASSGLAAQVWVGNPHVECLLHTPDPLTDLAGAIRAMRAAKLFGGEPYTTLLTTGNERSRITLSALLAGRSRRVGFAVHPRLLHTALQWDPALSQIANNLRLLPAAGIPAEAAVPEPRIYAERGAGFAQDILAPLHGMRIAVATQTSPTQRKSWRPERWVEVAIALRERYAADLTFVGTAAEAEAIDAIRERIPFATANVAGQTTIQELAAVFAACRLAVTLDTGPLHVARAVGLSAVVIAPAWSPAIEWLPVGHPRYRILKNADFPPPAPADYVIDEVSSAEVLEAFADLLQATA